MADEQHLVRGVSWNEVFGFSHIFKSFKMAIHPTKILLALIAIVVTFVLGMVMDRIWSGVSQSNRVMANEAWAYWLAGSRASFLERKRTWTEVERPDRLQAKLVTHPDITTRPALYARENFAEGIEKLREKNRQQYEKALEQAKKAHVEALKAIQSAAKSERERLEREQRRQYRQARQAALAAYVAANRELSRIQGGRIFASFLDWQGHCLRNAVAAVRRGHFTGGLEALLSLRRSARERDYPPAAYRQPVTPNRPGQPTIDADTNAPEAFGVLAWLALMAWGVWWLISTYPVYAVIYIVVALAVWSLCGGAICRAAALHAAREEKISLKASLKFGISKFLSYFTSPLLPLALIVALGLCLAAGGLIGAIPYVGEWFVGLLFGLALVAGAGCAFLTIGLVGGWPLMWPTIAVEGSDSFDAISRSFSYVFARPFRYLLYWLVAAVYGVICYLFVRLFAFLTLAAVHCWAGWAMRLAPREHYATGAGKLDVMWATPTFTSFHGPMQTEALGNWCEVAMSYVIGAWVYLVSGIVLAFLACFIFSASTNIYFLLRRKVDATDLDDVCVEEEEEEQQPEPQQPSAATPAPEAPASEEAPTKPEDAQDQPGQTPPNAPAEGEDRGPAENNDSETPQ